MFIRTEKSSQIHSHHYEPDTQNFHVRFSCRRCKSAGHEEVPGHGKVTCPDCGGKGYPKTYTYTGVPVETYVAVRDAESVGSAMHKLIVKNKDRFPFTKS